MLKNKEGLLRLLQAVLHPTPTREHPLAQAHRIRVCMAWCLGDTPTTAWRRDRALARDPEHLLRQTRRLRRYLPQHRGRHLDPHQVAQAYLAHVHTITP